MVRVTGCDIFDSEIEKLNLEQTTVTESADRYS